MSIKNYKELLSLKEVGRIVRLALEAMSASVRAGVTTAQLDECRREFDARKRRALGAADGLWFSRRRSDQFE